MADSLPLLLAGWYVKLFQPETILFSSQLAGLALYFHPLLSALISYFILRKQRNEELLIFFILSFLTSVLTVNIFAVAGVQVSISYFWPLFFLVIDPKPNRYSLLMAIVLIIALGFSYDASIFLLFVILIVTLYRFFHFKEKFFLLIIFLCTLSILWHFYLIIKSLGRESAFIEFAMNTNFSHFFKFTAFIFVFILFSLILAVFHSKFTKMFHLFSYISLTLIFLFLFLKYYSSQDTWGLLFWEGAKSRMFSAQITSLCALLAILFKFKIKDSHNKIFFFKFTRNLLAVGLLTGFFYDLSQTVAWNKGFQIVTLITNKANNICTVLPRRDYRNSLGVHGQTDWGLPYMSMLLQNKRTIEKIVLVDTHKSAGTPDEICHNMLEPALLRVPGRPGVLIDLNNVGYFDLSPLRKGLGLD